MALPIAMSVLAVSRTTPPSAHSILQSPSAISGSASTTRRPSKPRARAISSSSRAGGLVQRVVDAHDDVRRRGKLLEAFGGERRDLGERLARHELRRELARDRDRKLDGFGFEPLLDRRKAARQPIERVADLLEAPPRCGARRPRCLPSRRRQSRRESPCSRPRASMIGVLGRRDRLLGRPAPGGEVLVEQIFGLRAAILNRSAPRRATWRG